MARSKLNWDSPLLEGAATPEEQEAQETPKAPGKAEKKKEPTAKKIGRPRRGDLIRDHSSQAGLTEDYTRFSCICKVANLKDLKDYAYTKRIPTRDAIDEIIEFFFKAYRGNPKNEKLLDHTMGNGVRFTTRERKK